MEGEEAGKEFDETPDGWKPDIVDDVPQSWEPGDYAKRLEKEDGKNDDAQHERTGSQGGLDNLGDATRWLERNESPDKITEGRSSGKNKFRFKQSNIKRFFKDKELLNLDNKMKQLEKEKLLDMKRRKENEWKVRRLEEKTRQAKIWAADMMEEIITTSWEILESNEQKKKEKRLETAGWKSLTARVSNWKIEDDGKDKHQSDKKRRKEWEHTDSPSKKARGGKGVRQGSTTTSPDLPAEKNGPVQLRIKAIEAKTNSGGPKKPQINKKTPSQK